MLEFKNFPPQTLPFSRKNKEWRKKCVLWAKNKTFFNFSLVRKSVIHKKINYDLLNGKLHMRDMEIILNPENIKAGFIPERIQHYPIMNSKLNVLRGEEAKRVFDFKVVVTNPNAISQIEENKKQQVLQDLQQLVADNSMSEEDYNQQLAKLQDYYTYEWQDMKEIRANALVNHYRKEYNLDLMFNQGFMDAMCVGEELYQCDIVGGEPTIERLNPLKTRIFKSGYSNKVEDADVIILEDYWSPGKIIDVYYESLSPKDIKYIENLPDHVGQGASDNMSNVDERLGFVHSDLTGDEFTSQEGFFFDPAGIYSEGMNNSLLPYDLAGNIRVLRVYWKSRRKIKKVKSYDMETGEEVYNFFPENHIINKDMGEEEFTFFINEAWEGTLIGEDIYVNMRPRVIQYNRLSNPSRCHFGIVGSIYNLNDNRPFSLVDMMKPYNYLYNAVHDRLNKAIAANWGKIIRLDLAKVPKGWDVEKWLYYAKINKIAVEDSFKEGNIGASTGILAGGMNNASSGVIDAETGNHIQQQINLLEFIKMEMSEVAGITRQREGQVSHRETVGGIERATLQSSHITEWLFTIHNDVKKRALECFLETAKIALKGRNKKFQYILSDNSMKIMDIDGDEFAEADYGLVVDYSEGMQKLQSSLEQLAQAALQTQTLSFSTITKLYSSSSIAEKQRLIEKDEQAIQQRQQEAQQAQLESQERMAQAEQALKEAELQQKESANIRDNETKLLIATMNANNLMDDGVEEVDPSKREELLEKMRQFDEKIKLDKDKFSFEKTKHADDVQLKRRALSQKPKTAQK